MITLKHDDQWHQDLMTKGGFHQVYDNDIPSRARLTCPPGLSIKAVKDHLGKPTFGVFAKKIVQVRTRYGPLQAPVKSRVRCEPTTTPQQPVPQPSCMTNQVQDVQKSIPNQQASVQEQQRSIQEVAMDRNNVEHQDIVQQALGIVKVDPQQMMSEEHTPGSYGDVVTTIANSLSESMNLSTTLPSGDMTVPGQFGSGHIGELGLTVPIENSSVTEGIPVTLTPLQAHNLLGHINANHFPSVTTSSVLNNQQEIIPIVSTETQMLPQTSENQSVENTVKNVLQSVVSELVSEPTPEQVEDRPEQIDPADQPFEIKVFHEDGIEELLDLSDEDKCNWMMFVRPARTAAEQNVVVYQFENRIYFASTKPIPSNTEIRVWYEADYAVVIKKKLLPDGDGPASAAGYPPKWACSVCLEGFSTFNELEAHVCPGEPISENKRLRGRPRKGRPRKYVKPSKTWRARLEKSRLPPRKRGRPPKLKGSIITIPKPPKEAVENLPIPDSHPMEMLDQAHELPPPEDKDDDDDVSALELLEEVLGEDDDDDVIPVSTHRRRGRKKRLPGAPRAPRIPKREPMQCPHCEETFTKEALFVIHVAEHTGIKPYICEVAECQKGFMSKFKLERHRLIHTCPRSHKCLYCDKCFNRKDHLKNHMITHDPNKKRWVCEECGKEYSYNFSYRTHKAFHDADAGRTTECGICHKVYDTKEELLYHLKVHSGARSVKNCTEKTHACEDCGKTFYTRKDVRRHMITHTKRKDFLCQYCPQRFGRKDHLTRHLRSSHSGDNNNRVRAPRAERKEKPFTSNISIMGSLQLPRDDPNVLVTSQPSLVNYQQLQAFTEIPVPLHMFENTSGNQSVITMANLSGLQQQQQPQQQQQQQQSLQVIQGVQHAVIPNQMQPVAENRQSVDTTVVRYPTQHIESPTPNDYRSIQSNQTHSGGIQTYIPLAAQQPQQQVQQHVQGKNDANIDLTRTNGVLQVEYQVPSTRNDQNARPAIIQASNTTPREGSQTFSTLLGYMETLRFLENLPTNAQTSVISQLHMHQDGQQLPTMVPMQTTLAYSVATTTNNQTHQLIPVEMQTKRMTVTQAQHNAYQQGS